MIKMLKLIYTVFVGILLALFVGVGVSVFYTAPKAPDYPKILESTPADNGRLTDEQKRQDAIYQQEIEAYGPRNSAYNRNVSIITLAAAVLMLVLGLAFAKKIDVIADGLLLGGVFTLLYSIGRGFASEQNTYRFIVVSAGLAIAIILGYLKFSKPQSQTKR